MRTSLLTILAAAALGGCANLPSASDDPDHALCELARAQALRGDPASEATLDRIRDLRTYHYCKYELMMLDRNLNPYSND